ncbi:hypothetical protein C3B51_00970 [Pseudoalteromonas rubra]|uniref:Lipoprotein n=1 Tax=Pseudoalteromonas rubra TaxID=43658 RepID=A0A4Q7ENT4_9GAMM|nr:hypothetical protein [Pseudoalteromonas rubra]RZM85252.1 hypothetical protein C3B51_00970 [Pseudoalteromonas rubra]
MKIKALLFLASSALLLAGCNSTNNTSDDGSQAKSGYRCKQVRALGSNIPKTYCSNAQQRKEAREAAQEEMRNRQTTTPTFNRGG